MNNNNLFDPHARVLHKGQYSLKETDKINVPIKSFYLSLDEEKNVQQRIDQMRQEISDLENQIAEKRKISQEQADKILEQVKDEAKKVMEEAEQHAFDRVQKSVQEKDNMLQQTQREADQIISKANSEANDIRSEAQKTSTTIKEEARQNGFQSGFDEGLNSGKEQIDFAVERLHNIVAETARERERILFHSEEQVINLIITMVSKVVKRLTSEQKDIVIENAKAALELLRSAMTIFIRVSPLDFNYAQSFKKELINKLESRSDVKFVEDPTIEPGGVYIESDTGDIDATIKSQLEELENQMRFYMPVKVKTPEAKKRLQTEKSNSTSSESKPKDVPPTQFSQREEFVSDPNSEYYHADTQSSEKTSSNKTVDPVNTFSKDVDNIIVPEIIDLQNGPSGNSSVIDSYKENTDHTNDPPESDDVIV
ncbi:MAG: flagellar assembly protein FliH [Brevinemataceae bacterium]